MTASPQISQVALCSSDIPLTLRVLTTAFGFADAGGKTLWGRRVAAIQELGDDMRCVIWWLVGRQDLVQLEFFHHSLPVQKPLPADWRPSDLGWVRFGIAVPDFDASLERLGKLGVNTLTAPVEHDGLRRVCFREPGTGAVVEVMEEGAALPGGIRPRHYDLAPALVYAAISVPELGEARRFFVETLGLAEEPGTVLHTPAHEALWGLPGARRESFVVRGGDAYVEVVRYDDPPGRPKPEGYLLSDQGFMNIALGFREQEPLQATYDRLVANGYRPNSDPPDDVGGTYVNDAQGNTLELLVTPREYDPSFGFSPQPLFRRPRIWPRATVPPARG